MERGEADVAVLACDPDVPRSPFLEYEPLFEEQLWVLARGDHPLGRARRIAPQDLVSYPLILPPKGGADRNALERLLRKHSLGERVQTAVVCGLVDVAKRYVMAGVGVALMYLTEEVARSTPGLHVRPLDAEIERLPIELAVRKGTHLPEYVEEFRRIVQECLPVKARPG